LGHFGNKNEMVAGSREYDHAAWQQYLFKINVHELPNPVARSAARGLSLEAARPDEFHHPFPQVSA